MFGQGPDRRHRMGTVVEAFFGSVDICNVYLTSLSQVDNDLLEFHLVIGCAGWYGVLSAQADEDRQTTVSAVSCAAAISVLTHKVEARY